jgi:hypothetical protein
MQESLNARFPPGRFGLGADSLFQASCADASRQLSYSGTVCGILHGFLHWLGLRIPVSCRASEIKGLVVGQTADVARRSLA